MDPTLKTIGTSVGINIEQLIQKYSFENKCYNNGLTSTKTPEIETEKTETNSEKLDRLIICQYCKGLGLYTYTYNHQVRTSNCERCNSEGLHDKFLDRKLDKLAENLNN